MEDELKSLIYSCKNNSNIIFKNKYSLSLLFHGIEINNFDIDRFSEKEVENKILNAERELYEFLKKNPFIIYGGGVFGRTFIKHFCLKHQIFPVLILDKKYENNEDEYYNIPCRYFNNFQFSNLDRNLPVLICILNIQWINLITQELQQLNFQNILTINNFEPLKFSLLKISNNYNFLSNFIQNYNFYYDQMNSILSAFHLLEDEESKKIYILFLKSILEKKLADIPRRKKEEQYLPVPEIFLPEDYTNFIDCGAYVGDTILSFYNRGIKMRKIVCFEPDFNNFKMLVKTLDDLNIPLKLALMCGVSSKNTILRFHAGFEGISCITANGNDLIQVVKLDDILSDFKPTLIKMDIEGEELEALKGATQIIQQSKPKLAIAVYHHPEHLWRIPLYLKSINPKYKFFLRKYESGLFETILYAT